MKEKKQNLIPSVLGSVLLSAELCFLADLICALFLHPVQPGGMLCCFAAAAGLFLFLSMRRRQNIKKDRSNAVLKSALIVLITLVLLFSLLFGIWYLFFRNAKYQKTDDGLSASEGDFFRNKNVMLIVPHQDDDLNLLGGVLEEYALGGSTVHVVFTTNGDFGDRGEDRIREAIQVLGSCGISQDRVIFLGYGDGWDDIHLYNTPAGSVRMSHAGFSATYGTEEHPAYNDGNLYTSDYFLQDLQDVIMEYLPDVIYCVDYDDHADHRAASLFFDKAMGEIKKQNENYSPVVYKGFAYSTAYYAVEDFYHVNVRSTVNERNDGYASGANVFRWVDRVRIPVLADSLSRSILNTDLYQKTRQYGSQSARFQAVRMVNGDRVFWQRDCSSLLYTATVTVSSGEAEKLNDFMLLDSRDVNSDGLPFDGVWIPAEEDSEKTAVFTLPEPRIVDRICLYDNPSLMDNILNAEIVIHSGDAISTIETGALEKGGAPTVISLSPTLADAVEVRISASEGTQAGLTEVEATCSDETDYLQLVKLQNRAGDFAYDYICTDGEEEIFSLYALNCSSNLLDYSVSCDNERCRLSVSEREITLFCPRGERCVLSVRSKNEPVSDSIVVRNDGMLMIAGQQIESFVYHNYSRLQTTAAYAMARSVFHLFTKENLVL